MSVGESRDRRRRTSAGFLGPLTMLVLACLLFAGVAAVIAILTGQEDEEFEGSKLVYGLTLMASDFDPHSANASEPGILLYSVYDMLIYRHPETGEFVPGLAQSWEVSDDGLEYTFYLREDVTFHDGTEFNADAVGVTFDRIMERPGGKSFSLLGGEAENGQLFYNTYVIEDTYRIKLLLNVPYAPLLDALSQPYFGIVSPTAIANTPTTTYQFNQVGTGPYKMIEFLAGDRIILERYEDYTWGPDFYAPLLDTMVDRIEFRFFEDEGIRRLALESEDVQILGEIPPDDAQALLSEQDFGVIQQPVPGQPLQFYLNTQRVPTDDPLFRQALLQATDREDIVDRVFFRSFSPVAYGPVSASMPFYDPQVQTFYPYNQDAARQLFAAMGFEDTDADGILERDNISLELTMVIAGWGSLPEVAALLQSQWRTVGIEVEIIQVPNFTALIEAANSGEYHLIALNDFGADPIILNRYYLSDGDRNWTGYSDADLDLWLRQAAQELDTATRGQLYSLIQQRIMEQALILPIRDYVNLVGYHEQVNSLTRTSENWQQVEGPLFTAQGWWPLLNNMIIE